MSTARAAELIRDPQRRPDAGGKLASAVTRIRPSVFPRAFARRPGLVSRLVRSEMPLILIVAPPGYGKSSLVAEWEQWDERSFVWFSPTARSPRQSPVAALRGTRRRPLVAVLDRAERVPKRELGGVVEGLLDELSPGSALVVCSRVEPRLPEGRLRAHRLLLELRRRDLELSVPQAAELLRLSGGDGDHDIAASLVRATRGWPAAIYLAALSKGERGTAREPGRFLGDDDLLSQYLQDEVLSQLSAQEIRWLSRCAVAEELSPKLCEELSERAGAGRTLPDLARRTQLLDPVDAAGHRYRWHGLFRECMRGELRRREPDKELQLHLSASLWHERQGDNHSAIEHACRARDPERAGELLSRTIVSLVASARAQNVLDWLSCFSRDQIASRPALAMSAAHGCLGKGSVAEAIHWAAIARAALEGDDRPFGPNPDVGVGIAVAEAATARGGAGAIIEAATRAQRGDRRAGPWRPVYLHLLGMAEHLLGRRSEAAQTLGQAVDLAGDQAPCTTLLALSQLAMIAIEREDWELAEELARRASTMMETCGLDRSPAAALCFAISAAVDAHQRHIDEAKLNLRRGLELHSFFGDPLAWYGAQTSILLAHAALSLADVATARTLLAQGSRFSRKIPDAVIFERWFTGAWEYLDTLAETSLAGPSSLTIAELRVLRFLPTHRSFREIAAQLGVSPNTVKSQAHAVYRKLGASSRSEAVTRGSEAGLLG